jgi:hypothetical protein
MPQPELVEDVRVGGRDVGDRVVAEDEPLEHRLVDDAPGKLLVGAERLHSRVDDRGAQQLLVHRVEVHRMTGRVGLAPERHKDEAEGAGRRSGRGPRPLGGRDSVGQRLIRHEYLPTGCGDATKRFGESRRISSHFSRIT